MDADVGMEASRILDWFRFVDAWAYGVIYRYCGLCQWGWRKATLLPENGQCQPGQPGQSVTARTTSDSQDNQRQPGQPGQSVTASDSQ